MQQSERELKGNLLDFAIRKTQKNRLQNQKVQQAIYGLIAWFEDNQIRDRQAALPSQYHYSEASIPSKSRITVWPGFKIRHGISLPMFLRVRNKKGEWSSQLHALPEFLLTGNKKKARLSVQDSNMFISGFCSLSLLNFSEQTLGKDTRVIEAITEQSAVCIAEYQNGNGYNFWPLEPPVYGSINRRGPLNIWMEIADKTLRMLLNKNIKWVFNYSRKKLSLPSLEWLESCLSDPENKQGVDAIFNIANDADNSALALSFRFLTEGRLSEDMQDCLRNLESFRDLNRSDKTPENFERWKEKNSGAFLTWLKDETDNPFEHPEKGLIPGGKNNVDVVVNANIVYTLELLGKTSSHGYRDAIQLLCRAIENKTWPGAGLYYPQKMMFPYAVSRAIRDGDIQNKRLLKAQNKLMRDVLSMAKSHKQSYYFEGGKDKSRHLSTALALNALLNMGEQVANNIGKLEEYQSVLEGSLDFLLNEARYKPGRFSTTLDKFAVKGRIRFIPQWEDGLFFGPVHWDLCHWRSQAVTHAAILEAMQKYMLAYDKSDTSIHQNLYRLTIRSYDYNALQEGRWLRVSQKNN